MPDGIEMDWWDGGDDVSCLSTPVPMPTKRLPGRPEGHNVRFVVVSRVALSVLAGAVIAWVMTAFVVHSMLVAGGYTRESIVELPPWSSVVIGGSGGLIGLAVALSVGGSPLPRWVRPTVMGGLAGVAAVVVSTLGAACSLGGP